MQVVAVALEEVVRPDRKHNVQIALGTARAARVAFARVADARSLFHARRHLHIQLDLRWSRASRRGRPWQGSPITEPVPPHALQVRATEKNPC